MVVAKLPSWNARVEEFPETGAGVNAWEARPLFNSGQQVGTAQVYQQRQ